MWGAATSAHQVEGNNSFNDWWAWEQTGRVPSLSGMACDQYNRFESDLDLAQSLGHTAHRFSIEWSRVEPSPGQYSEEALSHYEKLIQACRKRNIEPIVTLHHFTNPQWFASRGGWLNGRSVDFFVSYVDLIAQRFGRSIDWWVTINEPTVFVYQGYLLGVWPPGEHSIWASFRVMRNLIRAHRRSYEVIHWRAAQQGGRRPAVGIAHHVRCYDPCRKESLLDRWAAAIRHRIGNLWMMNASRAVVDFIGVNYYTRDFIQWDGLLGTACPPGHHPGKNRSGLGWEIYPEGLARVLKEAGNFHLPVLITENGISTNDDCMRTDFIRHHLNELVKAQGQGIPVVGYIYWALIDNFEWAEGFNSRFGLIEVDYTTQARRIRPSAHRFSELIRECSSRSP